MIIELTRVWISEEVSASLNFSRNEEDILYIGKNDLSETREFSGAPIAKTMSGVECIRACEIMVYQLSGRCGDEKSAGEPRIFILSRASNS